MPKSTQPVATFGASSRNSCVLLAGEARGLISKAMYSFDFLGRPSLKDLRQADDCKRRARGMVDATRIDRSASRSVMAPKQQPILVVDDCPVSRGMAHSILAACGYDAVECGSGTQCIDFLEKEIPALILLDISMPDIDGFDLLRLIRHRHAADSVPVLLVTASTDGKDVVRGLTTGANDYLTKPLDRTAFLARVYNHISLSQARRQNDEHRDKVVSILGMRRAIEELNHEAIFAHRNDGSLAYCNELLGRVVEGAPALRAEELAVRLMERGVYMEIRSTIAERPSITIDRIVPLPEDIQRYGYQPSCRVRSAIHGDVRIWVFQFEERVGTAGSDVSSSL